MKKFKIACFIAMLIIGMNNVKALEVSEDLTLTENLTEQVIVNGHKVVINLNGHNITVAANGALVAINGANVTIKGEGTIESTNSNGVVVSNGSTVVLENGAIKSVEFGALVTKNSTFTMNGGTITTSDNCGIGGNGTNTDNYKNYTINFNGGVINGNITTAGYVSCGIYHPNKGTVNVTGGVINSSNGAGIVQRAGELNVTGGTINAKQKTEGITGKVGDSRVVVSASAIVVDKEANYPEVATLTTKISKNVVLNGDAKDIETIGSNINIELTGGIYSEEPAEEQIPEGYSAYKVLEGNNEDKYVVVKEDELKNITVDGIVEKSSLESNDVALIENTAKNKFTLVSFYEVNLITVTPDNDIVGYVAESNEAVEVTLGLPQEMPKIKDGYVRKYYIIRVHNGEATLIDNVVDNGDGTISFKSDKFSTYALAYNDVVKTVSSPNTFDGITIYIIILIGSISTMLILNKYLKTRSIN